MIKKVTAGLFLDDELKEKVSELDGFIRFIDDEYWEQELDNNNEKVVVKRNNGEVPVLPFKVNEHDYEIY